MISALNFKSFAKGALIGFFDLRYHGCTIKGARLMAGNNGLWIALPQRQAQQDGETKWFDQMFFSPPETEHIRRAVIADLESQGHIDRPQSQPCRTYRAPDNEDLSEYRTQPGDDNVPF